MNIRINNKTITAQDGETLIETARRAGFNIPSLCYAGDAVHKPSCMICAVKDCKTGQIIPSCSTMPVEDMQIDTESPDVVVTRTLSLELLLSDHRADCEAPCSMVCPHGLDIERMLYFYDNGNMDEAFRLIATAFPLPELKCTACKIPCEKVCRRGTVDKPVAIRALIEEICKRYPSVPVPENHENGKVDKPSFLSRVGRFTESEKKRLKEVVTADSRCLHCACAGKKGCKLRQYAGEAGIKRSRYDASSALPAMSKQDIGNGLWFEPAKCIKCGLCVYNSENGFTFKNRGFVMQIVLPPENCANINSRLADLCPTGAIYLGTKNK
ncbi:MAG: (2Fe-2S)-binding protein [Tannerella sp.]|jgi:predicted molibdopterin-dependent oxidoreductase YjgC|nr:(2Fe-2S)-binding protein [Tannerella sp.]